MSKSANDKASKLKAALEAYAGNKIDASPQQIVEVITNTPVAFSSYSFTPAASDPNVEQDNVGKLVSRPFKVGLPASCSAARLLDVSAYVRIPDTGHASLRLNNFICSVD